MAIDWATQQAESFKAGRERKQQESEKSLSDRKLKERSLPRKWDELLTAVARKTQDFNRQMSEELLVFSVDSDRGFSVGRKDNHTSMKFYCCNPGPFDVTCTLATGQGIAYSLEIKTGDEVGFKSKAGGFQESEYIAENALTLLLRG